VVDVEDLEAVVVVQPENCKTAAQLSAVAILTRRKKGTVLNMEFSYLLSSAMT
jgi:hypothetical protein